MINITNIVTPSPEQWMAAIRGMRNPMNSWDKSDSYAGHENMGTGNEYFKLGKNDYDLMKRLVMAGTEHSKFLRMLPVMMDITAPLYWWKEFDTYKVGTVANSCSTMHKIAAKEFTLDDFSHDHLLGNAAQYNGYVPTSVLECIIGTLNEFRELYLESKNKIFWWQMIQLLPSSYNQKRTVFLNYAVLANIYYQRKGHKLDEWNIFCDMIEKFPHSEFITKRFE